jgi:hypothetical protein
MQNSFRNSGEPLSPDDIRRVELTIGITIPGDLADFYLKTNGGFPENTSWIVDGEEQVRVQCFLPMKIRTRFSNTIEATYRTGLEEDYLIMGLVPFAKDFGGNFVCFDDQGGIVFYTLDTWGGESDKEQNKKEAMTPITDSFQNFLDGLQPEPEY